RGLSDMFRVEHTTVPDLPLEWAGWEDNAEQPRSADELIDAFHKTWGMIDAILDRWTIADLNVERVIVDAYGRELTSSPAWVLWRVMAHEVHHGSEIS